MTRCFTLEGKRKSLYGSIGTFCLCARPSFWRSAGLRAQTAMALDQRSTRMDVCNLFSHSYKNDVGSQTCSSFCLFDRLRLYRDEYHLSYRIIARYALGETHPPTPCQTP